MRLNLEFEHGNHEFLPNLQDEFGQITWPFYNEDDLCASLWQYATVTVNDT